MNNSKLAHEGFRFAPISLPPLTGWWAQRTGAGTSFRLAMYRKPSLITRLAMKYLLEIHWVTNYS